MINKTIDEQLFKLGRPEYLNVPEMALSALVWSLVDGNKDFGRGTGTGLIYQERMKGSGSIEIDSVLPANKDTLNELYNTFNELGLSIGESSLSNHEIVDSLLKSLIGTKPRNSKSAACIPINPSAALLQDLRGILGRNNPANIAKFIQQIYQLGSIDSGGQEKAASIWYKHLAKTPNQPIYKFLNEALKHVGHNKDGEIIPPDVKPYYNEPDYKPTLWLADAPTPFSWFHKSWDRFCTDDWTNALPRRKWIDWSATILRTALGMSYIWESNFYKRLGVQLIGSFDHNADEAARYVMDNSDPLLSWVGTESALSLRDNNSKLIRMRQVGLRVKEILNEWISELKDEFNDDYKSLDGLSKWIRDARLLLGKNKEYQKQIELAYNGQVKPKGMTNVQELINYSLTSRGERGSNVDHYALMMRKSNRFLVIEPGVEWMVMFASITANKPGETINLSLLKKDLGELGIEYNRKALIIELEKSGLSTSAHDADDALEIKPSYFSYE